MRRPTGLCITSVLLCLAFVAGCNVSQLQFTVDRRLSFVTPHARTEVHLPMTVQWTMRDFEAIGLDGSADQQKGAFAVFVDQAPIPVGKDLRWLARSDSGCWRDPRCPDPQFLSDRGVHVTTRTFIQLEVLPPAPDGVGDEQHYVNVVLLDGTGRRTGESAWFLPFTSKRRSS